ncbi:MAG: hypothetical protein JSW43_04995 [Gemmatimonadota bacterium]|nr:MAG: hypothetical protein JSW43_04995 [Gemmatimonadota bacterium]
MKSSRFLAWTALVAGLAAVVPASASAQIGGLVKKKVKERLAGPDAAAASPAAQAAPGPVFNEYVLEITPDLLDRLQRALAAEAAAREENARRIGKVLPEEEYDRCEQDAIRSAEGQKMSEESVRLMETAKTDQQLQQAMEEMGKRLEAFMEPRCGLEPSKAERLRSELAPRTTVAAEEASGLTDHQLSILKERILPLCTATEAAAGSEGARIPTEDSTIFYVYSPGEVEALRPRCGTLAQALQAEG